MKTPIVYETWDDVPPGKMVSYGRAGMRYIKAYAGDVVLMTSGRNDIRGGWMTARGEMPKGPYQTARKKRLP